MVRAPGVVYVSCDSPLGHKNPRIFPDLALA